MNILKLLIFKGTQPNGFKTLPRLVFESVIRFTIPLVGLYVATTLYGVRFFSSHAGASMNWNWVIAALLVFWICHRNTIIACAGLAIISFYLGNLGWTSTSLSSNLWVVCIDAFLMCGIYYWFTGSQQRNEKNETKQIADILRGNEKGDAGEKIAEQAVDKVLRSIGTWFTTNKAQGFESAVLLPTGKGTFSSELDMLLATTFGVYVIEVKNWSGRWSKGNDGMLHADYGDGSHHETRKDPLKKTLGKIQRIMKNVPMNIVGKGIVINTHPQGSFDSNMGENYIHVRDLEKFFRHELDQNDVFDDRASIDALERSVFEGLDGSATAKHDHLMRHPPEGDIATYQNLVRKHAALAVNRATPKNVREIRVNNWFASFGILIASFAATAIHMSATKDSQHESELVTASEVASTQNPDKKSPTKPSEKKMASPKVKSKNTVAEVLAQGNIGTKNDWINFSEYNAVTCGMSRKEIENVIGAELWSGTLGLYQWDGITVTFRLDYDQLKEKSLMRKGAPIHAMTC
jgi:Nuclease-related domain